MYNEERRYRDSTKYNNQNLNELFLNKTTKLLYEYRIISLGDPSLESLYNTFISLLSSDG